MPASSSKGASAPVAVTTTAVSFFSIGSCERDLFEVCAGHSVVEALDYASTFLATARDSAHDVCATSKNGSAAYAIALLVEMAKALVDSVSESLTTAESDPAPVVHALRDLIAQVESGGSANTCRAVAALAAWDAANGGGQ